MAASGFDNDQTRSFTNLVAGTKVSHYTIISKIGAGGMGEVYLANDTKLDRKVALKFLSSRLCQNEECRRRFKREAQAAAKLKHPNIITIYEVGEYQSQPYFAMELIEGQSLRDLIKQKELNLDEIINFAIQVCEGLDKAHQAGIVHRDIKPTNIMIDADGRPKLLDFGLAAVQGSETITRSGSTMGTVGYMSPEQVRGEKVDACSDMFSLGVVLYEMITAKSPFKRDNDTATSQAILYETPQPLARYRVNVPDSLQSVIEKVLDKNLETRYQSAAGLLADLKRVKADSESDAPSKLLEISRSRIKRILIPTMVLAIAVLVLILRPWKFEISPTDEAVAADNRLAIMYFDNLADPEDVQKLGEIAANLLITDMSESRYVQVVSSQRLYDILKLLGREGFKKVDKETASQVAKKAHAKWMLLGSILQIEPEIILTAQLVEVASGNVIASQRVNGEKEEKIFSLIDKVTVKIKGSLSLPVEALDEPDRRVVDITTQSPEAYRYFLEGMDYHYKYMAFEAERSFNRALEFDSTFAMAYYGLSFTQVRWGERRESIAKAVNYVDKVSQKEKYYIIAQQAWLNRNHEKAFEAFASIVDKYSDEKIALYLMGNIYSIQRNIEAAISMYLRAVEIDPLYKVVYNELAYAYDKVGSFEKSLWAINKYIDLVPNEANPYDTRGDLYAFNGKLEQAIASYKRALEIDPDFLLSIQNLGNIYLLSNEYSKAESLYQVMAVHPNKYSRAAGRLMWACIPMFQGKFQQALRLLEIGKETDRMELGEGPKMADKTSLRAVICEHLKDFGTAKAEAERARDNTARFDWPNDINVLVQGYVPYLYAITGDHNKADSLLSQLEREIDTSNSVQLFQYYFVRGQMEFAEDNFDSAAIYFKKSDKAIPVFVTKLMIARSYFEAGKLGNAVTMFEQAMRRYDNNRVWYGIKAVKSHYWLGMAYEKSGWDDKAIEQYETFLDIWKNADEGLESVEDAKERLAKLKHGS